MSDTAANQALFNELEQATGAWSSATGIAPPSAQQVAAWQQQYGNQPTVASQFGAETQNIGYYSRAPYPDVAAIRAQAQADPRWVEADQLGQQILLELYNEKAQGYGGDIGQFTPLPPASTAPTGDLGIGSPQTAPGTLTSTQQDAWDQIQQTLANYNFSAADLASLTDWAKNEIIAGSSPTRIALDLLQTPQFKNRFPAIDVLSKQGVAITAAQYIQLEQSYAQLEQAAGLPANYADYDKLIASQVSPTEYSNRLTQGYLAVARADPTVVAAMQDYYGVTPGQLAGYFLDPTKGLPILQQQAISAEIGGAAALGRFNNPNQPSGTPEGITQAQALRLAQLGVTQPQAQTGFRTLTQEEQLYGQLPGGGRVGNPLTTDQLLNSQFGSDGQTQLQLELQAQYQKGTTAEGTGVGTTSQGAVGVGRVQR